MHVVTYLNVYLRTCTYYVLMKKCNKVQILEKTINQDKRDVYFDSYVFSRNILTKLFSKVLSWKKNCQ